MMRAVVTAVRTGKSFPEKGTGKLVTYYSIQTRENPQAWYRFKGEPAFPPCNQGDQVAFNIREETWKDSVQQIAVDLQVLGRGSVGGYTAPAATGGYTAPAATGHAGSSYGGTPTTAAPTPGFQRSSYSAGSGFKRTLGASKEPSANEVRQWSVNTAIAFMKLNQEKDCTMERLFSLAEDFKTYAQTGTRPMPAIDTDLTPDFEIEETTSKMLDDVMDEALEGMTNAGLGLGDPELSGKGM
eukprot:TRINITY_DN20782_c0_g1_i1.p1 TRINITY_DN20782_c0_g1~~TRINITY_DN20782_c0_g1_i1.p1  ORF type:complete len:241 (-),score=33.30 TRINITY_DN20782_c0_g1_i1:164-886(-)